MLTWSNAIMKTATIEAPARSTRVNPCGYWTPATLLICFSRDVLSLSLTLFTLAVIQVECSDKVVSPASVRDVKLGAAIMSKAGDEEIAYLSWGLGGDQIYGEESPTDNTYELSLRWSHF